MGSVPSIDQGSSNLAAVRGLRIELPFGLGTFLRTNEKDEVSDDELCSCRQAPRNDCTDGSAPDRSIPDYLRMVSYVRAADSSSTTASSGYTQEIVQTSKPLIVLPKSKARRDPQTQKYRLSLAGKVTVLRKARNGATDKTTDGLTTTTRGDLTTPSTGVVKTATADGDGSVEKTPIPEPATDESPCYSSIMEQLQSGGTFDAYNASLDYFRRSSRGSWDQIQSHLSSAFKLTSMFQPASSAGVHGSVEPSSSTPDTLPLYGFSLSPAGLLLPYHLGVLECLGYFGFVDESTPLAGASAGALAAVTAASNVPMRAAMSAALRVSADARVNGTARRLHMLLERELSSLIPDDAHERINARSGKLTIAHTQVFPVVKGIFMSEFRTQRDVIDNLLASCNIPFYFSKWPTVTCRGRPCVDGYFAMKRKYFGCPHTLSQRTIRICPFPASTVRLSHNIGDCISPDLALLDHRISITAAERKIIDSLSRGDTLSLECKERSIPNMKKNRSSDEGVLMHSRDFAQRNEDGYVECGKKAEVSCPASAPAANQEVCDSPRLPAQHRSITELLRLALDAGTPEEIEEMFSLGIADAFRWIKLEAIRHAEPKKKKVPTATLR